MHELGNTAGYQWLSVRNKSTRVLDRLVEIMLGTTPDLLMNTYYLVQASVAILGVFVALAVLCVALSPLLIRFAVNKTADHVIRQLFSEPYTKNLTEGLTALRKFGVQATLENELRSHEGKALEKPIGTARPLPNFDGLLFSPAAVEHGALEYDVPVHIGTVIGRRAARPMRISMPIMVTAMGYGVALNKPFARALAKGASRAGTAYNTGQGPALPEFRELAQRLIVQYHGAPWRPSESMMREADMIEIRVGQGANAGCGTPVPSTGMSPEVLQEFHMAPSESGDLYIPAGIPGVKTVHEFRKLVQKMRLLSRGAPIALKLAAGHAIERDLSLAIDAGFDVVVIDGAQGGTHGSPAILVDDFGIPTLSALCRAVNFLREHKLRDQIDVVISGGIRTPGDMLKALALGANAVYIGTAALFATTHVQITKAIPFEPPTQIAWTNGGLKASFDEDAGAKSLANFLTSCAEEMQHGIRALGKTSIAQVTDQDLVAWDPEVARITGRDLV